MCRFSTMANSVKIICNYYFSNFVQLVAIVESSHYELCFQYLCHFMLLWRRHWEDGPFVPVTGYQIQGDTISPKPQLICLKICKQEWCTFNQVTVCHCYNEKVHFFLLYYCLSGYNLIHDLNFIFKLNWVTWMSVYWRLV